MKRSQIEERLILAGVVGSTAYGLSRPESDIDVKGICIASRPYYLGFKTFEVKDNGWAEEDGQYDFLNGKDTSIYELRKILNLIVGNNPNAAELLWLSEYLHLNHIGERLIAERNNLLSKKAKHTYSGYAYSQIKRVETHRKWLLDPPTAPPKMEDYGFDEGYKPLTKSETNAFLEFLYICVRDCIEYMKPCEDLRKLLLEDMDYKGIFQQHMLPEEVDRTVMQYTRCSKEFIHLLHQTQTYRVALRHWESYLSWKTNRNPDRAAMEAKVGYDAKHLCHAIRLLETGHEILRDQVIIVDRRKTSTHRDLMEIRNGDWPYEKALARAEELRATLDETYEASTLRHAVDQEYVNELCIELVEEYGW